MSAHGRIRYEDIAIRRLDGPPEQGFDCGHPDQNAFLYEHAWHDQQEFVSTTYKYYVRGIFAAYASFTMDALPLAFRERGVRIRYETVGALKLAQLGVDKAFQGRRLGEVVIGDAVAMAQALAVIVGCRYVSVDARRGLETWYQRLNFKRNRLMQERRIRFAGEEPRPGSPGDEPAVRHPRCLNR